MTQHINSTLTFPYTSDMEVAAPTQQSNSSCLGAMAHGILSDAQSRRSSYVIRKPRKWACRGTLQQTEKKGGSKKSRPSEPQNLFYAIWNGITSLVSPWPEVQALDTAEARKALQEQYTSYKRKLQFHQISDLQDIKRVESTLLPVEIATALINDKGQVSYEMISLIKEIFIGNRSLKYPYQHWLVYNLDNIGKSRKIQAKIHAIPPPQNDRASIADVIRISLGLSNSIQVTEVHARRAAVAALLSHLRQGLVGSCFATALAINVLENEPIQCLEDFTQLIKYNKLTRMVDSEHLDFSFLMRMSHEYLDEKIEINRLGDIVQDEQTCKIWEAPGIVAALQAAGVEEAEHFCTKTIAHELHTHPHTATLKTSVQKFLHHVISYAYERRFSMGVRISDLENKAYFAYEGQTQNPLQRVWENAIAGMAETNESCLIISRQIEALLTPIKDKLESIKTLSENQKDNITDAIKQTLQSRLKILFDPNISLEGTSSDGHTKKGGFVAYDVNGHLDSLIGWKRIDTQTKYKRFIHSILLEARNLILEKDKPAVSKIYRRLVDFAHTPVFLRKCLRSFNVSNLGETDLLNDIHRLKHTPWIDSIGNCVEEILRIYRSWSAPPDVVLIPAMKAHSMFSEIINYSKSLSWLQKREYRHNPKYKKCIILSSRHTFNLTLGHPTILKAWDSGQDTEEWIEDNVLIPGKSIANGPATPLTHWSLIQYIANKIIPESQRESFIEQAENLKHPLPVKNLRSWLVTLIKDFPLKDSLTLSEATLRIDGHLVNHALPIIHKDVLLGSVVHFADSNWGESVHDLPLCFIVNPGNGELELWRVQENNRGFYPLDQQKWIDKEDWKILS